MGPVPTMAGVFKGLTLTPPRTVQQRIPVSLCRFPCGLYHSMLQSWPREEWIETSDEIRYALSLDASQD
jgi:hypothetical protein